MAISSEQVAYVARLARLDLTADEVERFRGQLDAVLERAQRLQALDLDAVEPTSHPISMSNVLREDEAAPPADPEPILANAPDRSDRFFRVPKILEDEA